MKEVVLTQFKRFPDQYQIMQAIEKTIEKDDKGKIISRKNTNTFIWTPDMDLSSLPEEIQPLATRYWTKEVKEAYLKEKEDSL